MTGWFSHMTWECHHPNWRTHIFFRWVGQPPARYICTYSMNHRTVYLDSTTVKCECSVAMFDYRIVYHPLRYSSVEYISVQIHFGRPCRISPNSCKLSYPQIKTYQSSCKLTYAKDQYKLLSDYISLRLRLFSDMQVYVSPFHASLHDQTISNLWRYQCRWLDPLNYVDGLNGLMIYLNYISTISHMACWKTHQKNGWCFHGHLYELKPFYEWLYRCTRVQNVDRLPVHLRQHWSRWAAKAPPRRYHRRKSMGTWREFGISAKYAQPGVEYLHIFI